MRSTSTEPDIYISGLPPDRQVAMSALRSALLKNLPAGFAETMSYGMITYVVPHSLYPDGYHCDPKQALPFLSIASQKNYISVYHMGIYVIPALMEWFLAEYAKAGIGKPDIGKSCIRFKKPELIPLELLGRLAAKISVKEWILLYEEKFRKGSS